MIAIFDWSIDKPETFPPYFTILLSKWLFHLVLHLLGSMTKYKNLAKNYLSNAFWYVMPFSEETQFFRAVSGEQIAF